MKSGYDQFFKTAKNQAAIEGRGDFFVAQEPQQANQNQKKSQRRQSQNIEKKPFPIKSFFMFFILIGGVFVSIQYLDKIDEFLSNLEISMSSALANSEAPTDSKASNEPAAAAAKDPQVKANTATKEKSEVAVQEKSASNVSDDPTDYMFKLADRKKQLDQREADLNRREEEITKLKSEIEAKLVEIKNYRSNISTLLQDRVSSDSAKVETLVQVYSTMKPSQAAKVFETMDEDLVIEILSKMKKKNAADILNLVKSDKAQILAEKYAGYRLPDRKVSAVSNSQSAAPQEPLKEERQQPTKEESDQ